MHLKEGEGRQMIYHIISQNEWDKAKEKGMYEPESLKQDTFIHCSTEQQVAKVANNLYKGRIDLLVLEIQEDAVKSRLVYEDLYQLNEEYPHVYGPLNLEAVRNVYSFVPNQYGEFEFQLTAKN